MDDATQIERIRPLCEYTFCATRIIIILQVLHLLDLKKGFEELKEIRIMLNWALEVRGADNPWSSLFLSTLVF